MSQLQQNRLPEHFYDEPFALCFSGQGFDWISSLREALADGARDRANEVAAAAARILKPVAGQIAAARPQGFEPIKWAENGADGIDLVRAAVSVPGIFLSQIANLYTLEARGLDCGKAAGVIGHSQGILGRYLMREPQHAAELLALAELIGAAATQQGRATGMYLHDGLHPMVMVQGVSRGQLAAVIDKLFPADSADRPCIGFHHPAMLPAVAQTAEWAAACGLDAEQARGIAQNVLVNPVDWVAECHSMAALGVRRILEIGPSGGVAMLTQAVLAEEGIEVLDVSSAEGKAALFGG